MLNRIALAALLAMAGAAVCAAPHRPESAGPHDLSYPAAYLPIKKAADKLAQGSDHEEVDEVSHKKVFDAVDCSELDAEVAHFNDPIISDYYYLASKMAELRASLKESGYSLELYGKLLDQYEAKEIALYEAQLPAKAALPDPGRDPGAVSKWTAASDALTKPHDKNFDDLVRNLEARRRALQPGRRPIVQIGGCGAGERPVVVRTNPTGGAVWMITEFSFEVCKAKGLDPWDRARCRWGEVTPGQQTYLSGSYMYQAAWAGSRPIRGSRAIDPEGELDNNAPVTVWIGRQ